MKLYQSDTKGGKMKNIFKRIAIALVAVFCAFAFVGCGDEFANAQEVTKEEAREFAQAADVESLADGYKMTMKMNGSYSEGGVSVSMNWNIDISVLADNLGNITGIAGNVDMGRDMNVRVYLKDNYFYIDGNYSGTKVKTKSAFTESMLSTYNLDDTLSTIETYGDMIFDMLSDESQAFADATVTVKMLGDTETGNADFKIEAKQESHTAVAIVRFKENKLNAMSVETNYGRMSAKVAVESIREISYPGAAYFNSFN